MANLSDLIGLVTSEIIGAASNSSIDACSVRTFDTGGRGVLSSFAVFMGVLLICENIVLFTVIVRTRSLHNNTNILVASLAITDVLVGFQLCLMGLSEQPGGLRSWLGLSRKEIRIFDSFVTGLNFSLVTVSICHLSALALDRYLYVLWPLHYHLRVTRRRVVVTAGLLWTLGVSYCSVAIIVYRDPKYHVTCLIWDAPAEYGTWPLTSVYLLSMCVVFASTIGIAKIALKHKKKKQIKILARNAKLCCPSLRCNAVDDDSNKTRSPGVLLQVSENELGDQNTLSQIFTSKTSGILSSKVGGSVIELLEHDECPNKAENSNAQIALQSDTSSSDTNLWTYDAKTGEVLISEFENSTKQDQVDENPDHSKSSDQNDGDADMNRTDAYIGEGHIRGTTSLDNAHVDVQGISDSGERSPVAKGNSTKTDVVQCRSSTGRKDQTKGTRMSTQENMKIIKFILVMCGCFLLCTFLPLLSFLIQTIEPTLTFPEKLIPSMFIMLASNSGMNFFIITFMNKEFRVALIQTLPCCKYVCSIEKL